MNDRKMIGSKYYEDIMDSGTAVGRDKRVRMVETDSKQENIWWSEIVRICGVWMIGKWSNEMSQESADCVKRDE